jgi:hypothetical protein
LKRISTQQNVKFCIIYDAAYLETSYFAGRESEEAAARYRKIDAEIRMRLEQHWGLPPGACGIHDAMFFIEPHELIAIDPKAKIWDVNESIPLPDPRKTHAAAFDPFSDFTGAEFQFTVELAKLESAAYDALVLVSSHPVFVRLLKSVRRKGSLAVLVDLRAKLLTNFQWPLELVEQADFVLKLDPVGERDTTNAPTVTQTPSNATPELDRKESDHTSYPAKGASKPEPTVDFSLNQLSTGEKELLYPTVKSHLEDLHDGGLTWPQAYERLASESSNRYSEYLKGKSLTAGQLKGIKTNKTKFTDYK